MGTALKGNKIDYFIVNTNVFHCKGPLDDHANNSTFHSHCSAAMMVNAVGPIVAVRNCRSLFNPSCKIGFSSSSLGSISTQAQQIHGQGGQHVAHRMSKCALNCGAKALSEELKTKELGGHIVVTFHPGFVETDATRVLVDYVEGETPGVISIDRSVTCILQLMDSLTEG